jgi:hypothetical protein
MQKEMLGIQLVQLHTISADVIPIILSIVHAKLMARDSGGEAITRAGDVSHAEEIIAW